MKTRLWERTAVRVIIFLLCSLFVAGAFGLAVAGVSRYADFSGKLGYKIAFSGSDAFTLKAFPESESFRKTAQNQMYALASLYALYADKGGVDIDSGPAFERAVDDSLRDIYENMRHSIWDKRESYMWSPGPYEGEGEFSDDSWRDIPQGEMHDYTGDDWQFNWYGNGYGDYVYGGREIVFSEREMMGSQALAPDGDILGYDEPGVREAFAGLYPEQVEAVRLSVAENRRGDYERYVKTLGAAYYYIGDSEKWVTNVEVGEGGDIVDMGKLTEQPAWLTRQGRDYTSNPAGIMSNFNERWPIGPATVYIGWSGEQIAYYEGWYNQARGIIWTYFFSAAALLVASVVFLVWLLVFSGRRRPSFEGTRRLWLLDKVFAEIQIVALVILFAIGVNAVSWISNGYYHGWIAENGLHFGLFCAGGFALGAGLLWFLLSLVRNAKAGLFVKRSLIGLFVTGPCRALGGAIKSGFDGRNPLAKSLVLVILFWFVTAVLAGIGGIFVSRQGGGALLLFGFLLVLVLAVAIRFTYKWAERYGRLRRGVEEIAGGNLGYRIEVAGDGKNEFDRLSSFVNELGSAQNAALQSELKNQRLKTDLISNVSHDLKTPLTSILTYTDLLKTEGLESENAGEYLQVIDEKGQRLKKLTDDLFEAAKASSGAIIVRKEKVDLLELIEQEIAEMNGSFAEAGLELVIEAGGAVGGGGSSARGADGDGMGGGGDGMGGGDMGGGGDGGSAVGGVGGSARGADGGGRDGHYYVEADSQLLWRVVDNLLRNARKYAQPGTRVYVELKEGAPMTALEIKNTSATKLNIPPEELMERFKRGDESRATDGSGLGLAIAKDLVRLQNGWFEIFIDGDLFKAVVMLPSYIGQ